MELEERFKDKKQDPSILKLPCKKTLIQLSNYDNNNIHTVEDAIVFLKLREQGCPKKAAAIYSSSLKCKTDVSNLLLGPSSCKELKVKKDPNLKFLTHNGWLMFKKPNYDMGPGFSSSETQGLFNDEEGKRFKQMEIVSSQTMQNDYKSSEFVTLNYYKNLDRQYKFKGLNLNQIVNKCKNLQKQPEIQDFLVKKGDPQYMKSNLITEYLMDPRDENILGAYPKLFNDQQLEGHEIWEIQNQTLQNSQKLIKTEPDDVQQAQSYKNSDIIREFIKTPKELKFPPEKAYITKKISQIIDFNRNNYIFDHAEQESVASKIILKNQIKSEQNLNRSRSFKRSCSTLRKQKQQSQSLGFSRQGSQIEIIQLKRHKSNLKQEVQNSLPLVEKNLAIQIPEDIEDKEKRKNSQSNLIADLGIDNDPDVEFQNKNLTPSIKVIQRDIYQKKSSLRNRQISKQNHISNSLISTSKAVSFTELEKTGTNIGSFLDRKLVESDRNLNLNFFKINGTKNNTDIQEEELLSTDRVERQFGRKFENLEKNQYIQQEQNFSDFHKVKGEFHKQLNFEDRINSYIENNRVVRNARNVKLLNINDENLKSLIQGQEIVKNQYRNKSLSLSKLKGQQSLTERIQINDSIIKGISSNFQSHIDTTSRSKIGQQNIKSKRESMQQNLQNIELESRKQSQLYNKTKSKIEQLHLKNLKKIGLSDKIK